MKVNKMKVLLSGLVLLAASVAGYASDGLNDESERAASEAVLTAAGPPIADPTKEPELASFNDESGPAAVVPDCGTNPTRTEDLTVETALSALEMAPAWSENETCGTCSPSASCVGLELGSSCGVGMTCVSLLGTMCSDQQTWRCWCYSGAFP